VIRALILFEAEPDPERYQQHLDEFASKVPCKALRHGRIFGSPFGEAAYKHYGEFEWDDMESFKSAANGPEFAAAGEDAMAMRIPFKVLFASIE